MCADKGSYGSQHITVVLCVQWILWREGGGGGRAYIRVYVHMITELLSGYVLLPGDEGREGDHMHNRGLSGYIP